MSDAYFSMILDLILKLGSILSYVHILSRYFTKKPRFDITDISMNLTPRNKREPRLNIEFKVWNGKSQFKRFRASDALNVIITAIPITDEGETIEASTSNEPAGIIPVGRFHPSKHVMNIPKTINAVYVRAKCPEAVLTMNLRIDNYLSNPNKQKS